VTLLPHDLDRLRHAVDDDADRLTREAGVARCAQSLAAFDEASGGGFEP